MNVMSPTAHEKNEWKRMAADAFLHDRIATAVKFKDYGNLESFEKLCVQDYDAIMAEYRNWLLFGFGSNGLQKPENRELITKRDELFQALSEIVASGVNVGCYSGRFAKALNQAQAILTKFS